MTSDYVARRLNIKGIVQGVGFRPFIYNLAIRHKIKGEVSNTSSGVTVIIEGNEDDVESFCLDITEKKPPLSHITDVLINPEPVKGFTNFLIAQSAGPADRSTLISPDVSVCNDCLRELFDPHDRRYQYPFINCTNCGPRYTIISDIPYDRPETSMKHFKMCEKCQAEYDDPGNRRFHAQPNACEKCGPNVSLHDNNGKKIDTLNPIEKTAQLLKKGSIVAIKGLGGFHLAVDAVNSIAVSLLRSRKHREEKPFAVMSRDMESIRKYAYLKPEEKALLKSLQRPIVILEKRNPNPLSEDISPRNRYFGVMLPYTPLHYLLLSHNFTALVMTSGNMSEEPICIDNDDAFKKLSNIADYFLVHNRDIYLRSDDSIVKHTAGHTRFMRRSRGYVPVPVFLKKNIDQILACGGGLKSTVCLTKENNAFISQHIGDLDNQATYEFFQLTIRHMKQILDINPKIVAHDLHPDYLSTIYALELHDIQKMPVQHHHAHIASCMAENRLDGPVIGLAFDGTGYGTDGSIWGGEILIAEEGEFQRKAHLSYVSMPGGDAAIKEPWRMAVSYLCDAFEKDFAGHDLPLFKQIDNNKIKFIAEMISKKVNSPLTSSLGRFFDGMAAIIGIRNNVFFEGQAAMDLEMIADQDTKEVYDFEWTSEKIRRILLKPIICGVIKDMDKNVHISKISGKLHNTIIILFSELCEVIRKETGLNRVALSGGVFQNSIILSGLIKGLSNRGFKVITHSLVSTNDGGISLGQAVIAAAAHP